MPIEPYFENVIVKAVEKVLPSVVNIRTVRFVESFFEVFPVQGIGSGFIISKNGLILTNFHVVEGADEFVVTLNDGRSYRGRLIGFDAASDLALIRVNATDLPNVILGNSDKLKIGELAIAIGNSLGLAGTPSVTVGVISAINRHIKAQRLYMGLIQTDAAINPGNSGGPLINSAGEVVGINTAIVPYAQGIGFAIPINLAKRVVDDILNYGRPLRPWLGILGATITPQLSDYYGLPVKNGVIVVNVVEDSPADKAGIRRNDIIIALNDKPVHTIEELQDIVNTSRVGDSILIKIYRDNKSFNLETILESAE